MLLTILSPLRMMDFVMYNRMVRDEIEQLMDEEDNMVDLYLSRKLLGVSSPMSGSGAANCYVSSPTIESKLSGTSKVRMATFLEHENDVEELEMLLEAYFMQIDATLNKLTTVSVICVFRNSEVVKLN
ncbi:hypothetical protein SESBI_07131 [Sesbania bispinosa]|nr:hypothetical protein SESBI_07131 [Sesbania bispinosa]